VAFSSKDNSTLAAWVCIWIECLSGINYGISCPGCQEQNTALKEERYGGDMTIKKKKISSTESGISAQRITFVSSKVRSSKTFIMLGCKRRVCYDFSYDCIVI